MKTIQLSLGVFIAALTVLATTPAHAGGREHHSYYVGGFHSGNGHRHHYRGGHQRRHDSRRGNKHRRRHHHRHNDVGYLLGGIAIGSLINQAYHHNSGHYTHRRYHSDTRRYYSGRTVSRVIYRTTEPVVYREYGTSTIPEHVLLRDRDGRCFTVIKRGDGTELRTEIDAGACERD